MIYLGFDSSTQGLTATAIEAGDTQRSVLFTHELTFDSDLPRYGTERGVLPRTDPLTAFSSPLMWAEALDRVMAWIARESGIETSRIAAISGSAQQHGSVYLSSAAEQRFAALEATRPLARQIDGIFSRAVSPIWMDASTSAQCAAIAEAVGERRLLTITGSRAFERFTGPQIRKFFETDPAAYAATDRIHLVSSYLASLLAGTHAPIDAADGSGMNLMDLSRRAWAPDILEVTAPQLARRLPPIVPSWTVVGPLASYWTERYGLPRAKVVAWSGDNPCSMVGVGLVEPSARAISLGTSDTVFGLKRDAGPDPSATGHVFAAPTGDYMGITVFSNGSLARERVRDEFRLDWDGFSDALRRTPPGNGGAIMLPWFVPEITPHVAAPGVHRYGLEGASPERHVRAIVEAQMLAMARHSRWMGERVRAIHATGGAAANREILQVMADVFDADVYQLEVGNSASLGAALRACQADRLAEGRPAAWCDVVEGFATPRAGGRIAPVADHVPIYEQLAAMHETRERDALAAAG